MFEQGLAAIPLSVDLWVHYLDYITHTFSEPDQEDFVRKQFDRAVEACGLELRSDKMWDAYINWENSNKQLQRVTVVYDRLLATPVAKYMQHWTRFQDHVKKHSSAEVIPAEEFLAHRRSLRTSVTEGATSETADPDAEVDEAPPGVEDDGDAPGDTTISAPTVANEEENKSIQQLIISAREKVHQSTSDEVKQRWSFEDAIKRPYFHVKPLERSQLQAWRDYLEFEIKQGNERRMRTLFERCLIAAALYEEFWMRYLHYLETLSTVTPDEMRSVYERACTIHLKDKLKPHLSWANFEEENGNPNRALELLAELQSRLPEALEPHLQAVALERRRGNLEKAQELFESSLATFKEKAGTSLSVGYCNLLIKYARFLALFRGNSQQAVSVLQTVLDETLGSGMKLSEQEQQSLESLLWSMIEFSLASSPPNLETAASVLKTGTGPHFSPRIRLVFGHRYHQFVAECGHPGVSVSESTKLLRDLQQELRQLESAQEDSMDETLSEKAADNASNSSEHRREKRSGGSKSYSSSHNTDKSQQQNFPPPSGGPGHQQNGGGGNMGGGGGGGYNQPPSGGGGGNYQQYPPQAAAGGGGAPPPHQPPQHPPPQGQHQGYGGYNQNYQQQGYPPQQYQGWGYPQPQGGYGYNQQGWPGYPNYYGQR